MGFLQIIIFIIIDLFLVDNKNTIAIITNKLIKVNFNEIYKITQKINKLNVKN